MKEIYLIRHAKSSWSDLSLPDKKRPLNNRGKNDAPMMGKLLNKMSISPDLIYSSPAVRAYTTAKIIAEEINYPEDNIILDSDIYEASIEDILSIIYITQERHNSIFIFGHNPTFTYLANHFKPKVPIENVPTCGIVKIASTAEKWEEVHEFNSKVVDFFYPKLYK